MKTKFFNINIDLLNRNEFFSKLEHFFNSNKCNSISFLNAHCFNIAQKNPDYLKAINESDLLLNDGIGIKLACKLIGIKPKENMNGTDLIPEIMGFSARYGKKIYLLGGEEGIGIKAKSKIQSLFPNAEFAGVHSGFFTRTEEIELIDEINNSGAEVLVLGMGVPKQELWSNNNMEKFSNVRIIISGGAILDFLAEKFPRAPMFIRKIGMEWLFRLLQEPKRLSKRYLIGNIKFMAAILRFKLSNQI